MSEIATTVIPLIADQKEYPIPLTDRFAEFWEEHGLEEFWLSDIPADSPERIHLLDTLAALKNQFDHIDTSEPMLPGDPRHHQTEEVCFVTRGLFGVGEGKTGLHAEFELDTEDFTDSEIHCATTYWRQQLAILSEHFPHTTFFLASGDVTYRGRLTLNAFTPLEARQADQPFLFTSPYQPEEAGPDSTLCPTIAQLVDTLNHMVMNEGGAASSLHAIG